MSKQNGDSGQNGGSKIEKFVFALVTALLTLAGEYFMEGRKANLDVWKTVQNIQLQLSQEKDRRQIDALYEIQSELKTLEGDVVLFASHMEALRSLRSLKDEGTETAKSMSRIYPKVVILDSRLKTPDAAKSLLNGLSGVLGPLRKEPSKKNASNFLEYYRGNFKSELSSTQSDVEEDLRVLQSATGRTAKGP